MVDIISLAITGNHRDGGWYRLSRYGWFVAETRSIAELARHVELAQLREVLREGSVTFSV